MKLYLKNSVQIIEALLLFGKARIMKENEFMPAIQAFTKKYCPFDDGIIQKEIDRN